MADIQIWDGTAGPISGSTPFRFYDNDPIFQAEGPRVAEYCARRLGYPLLEVELQSGSFYACFEEAITTYGNEIFQYKIRENYLSMEGSSTGSSFNNQLIEPTLARLVQVSKAYGTEAGVGGNTTRYSGSIKMVVNQQNYDLDDWASAEGITGGIEIRRIFYQPPPAILRYFDPYAGTGTGIQSLMDAFDFGSYSPGINFLLMPASYDLLKVQAIEFNDQIRRSAYSFELVNNQLKIFPVPKIDGELYFEYFKIEEKNIPIVNRSNTSLVTNVGEVPYNNPTYGQINSVGRQWIYRYTLALAKELLAYVRGKYSNLPIPGSETTLNHAELLADGRSEKEALLTQLREMLDQTSRTAQLERRKNENEYLQETLRSVPLTIYVG
jgi:hypothetical protein